MANRWQPFSFIPLMTQSRPDILKLKLIQLWVFLTLGLICLIIIELATDWIGINGLGRYVLIVIAVAGLIGIFIELPEIKALTIVQDKIIVKNILTGKSKETLFTVIDEFKILIHIRRYSGLKFTLILLKQGNSHEPISLSYIDNLTEIINGLEKRLPNSTEDEYGLLDLMKQRQQAADPQQKI